MTHVLVVDDLAKWQSMLRGRFRRLENFDVEVAGTEESAAQLISTRQFDVAFVDLELEGGREGEAVFSGIGLIEHIRESDPAAVVVAYTAHIPPDKPVEDSAHHRRCMDAGADVVMSRATLFALTPTKLAAKLRELQQSREVAERTLRPMQFADDVATRAAVEVVGEQTLRKLIRGTLAGMKSDRVTALTGGYSGSWVLSIESESNAGEKGLRNVVKTSDRKGALAGEVRCRPASGSYFDRHGVAPPAAAVVRVGDWDAFWEREIVDAEPLARYIERPGTRGDVALTLRRVVAVCITGPAQNRVPQDGSFATQDDWAFTWRTALSVRRALEGVIRASGACKKRDRDAAEFAARLVERIARGEVSLFDEYAPVSVLHGDLHAENVFLEGGAPVLIDFSSGQPSPRLLDACSLVVDLAIARYDRERGGDNLVERMDSHEKWAWAGVPFIRSSHRWSGTRRRVEVLRDEIAAAVERDIDGATDREVARAMVFQLIRFSKFDTVTFAKRVVALRMIRRLLLDFEIVTERA